MNSQLNLSSHKNPDVSGALMEDELSWRTLPANFPHYPKSFSALRDVHFINRFETIFQKAVEAAHIMNVGGEQLCSLTF